MTELQALQWSMGTLGAMFVTGVSAALWIIYRLQQIPKIAQRQDDQSKEISRLSTAYVRVEERLRNLDDDIREIRTDIRAVLRRVNGQK